ncbi:TRAP transporter substrate-binding protein [Urechidicola croceus]|uniref:C4-dicarboxylate ABC transporter substrate-binding protein n=1 Tax=Urechidicola croceus TaxID=1850246 RepID=A0A1D8P7N6_9FLAO|nr:TRAP transporter substrate-binding protein [Urechidicola croceus]AOW20573.1 C4-dicarboxylate ABC transporter substrate-binding protein [Urechidicola croceus]
MRFKLLIILCISTTLFSCKKENKVKSIKLAHSLGVSHPVHEAMVFMAEKVAENSNGKLLIDIYPSSQLGSERQCLELLQIGSLGMTKVSAAVMENFSPELKVFGYPYLFRNNKHRFEVYDGEIGQKLLVNGEKYWLRGLTYFDAGNRSFYTKTKAIEQPKDLEGLKIRVMQSPTAIELVKSFGGAPTPISWGELYTALQQGVVDGAENNLPSFYSSKHYEICKYFSIDEHTSIPDILVISTIIWKDLSDEERKWLMDAVKEATVFQRELWAKAETEAMIKIEKAGVKVNTPDKSVFEKKSESMIHELKSQNPDLYELVNQIKSVN